jgi:hypothetical protein
MELALEEGKLEDGHSEEAQRRVPWEPAPLYEEALGLQVEWVQRRGPRRVDP